MSVIDTTVEIPRGEVDIKINPFEKMQLLFDMPNGIDDRIDNNNPNNRDLMWFDQVVTTATGLNTANLSNKEILFIVEYTLCSLSGMTPRTYDEFVSDEDEDTDFIGEGTLGVQ